MTRSAIRLLALTIFATTLAGAPAESGTSHSKHIKKHSFRIVRPASPFDGAGHFVAKLLSQHADPLFLVVQQIGLRLDSRKDPIETIVIDGGNPVPTEN